MCTPDQDKIEKRQIVFKKLCFLPASVSLWMVDLKMLMTMGMNMP